MRSADVKDPQEWLQKMLAYCILPARNLETLTIVLNFSQSNYVEVGGNYWREPSNWSSWA